MEKLTTKNQMNKLIENGEVKIINTHNLKGTYLITKNGNLFKFLSLSNGETKFNKIGGFVDRCGYVIFKVTNNEGKLSNLLAHRIVAEYFLSDFDKDLQVDHLDGVKSNNNVDNLECITAKENHRRWRESDRFKKSRGQMSKDEILEARKLWKEEGLSMVEIAHKFDRNVTNISRMLRGITYSDI